MNDPRSNPWHKTPVRRRCGVSSHGESSHLQHHLPRRILTSPISPPDRNVVKTVPEAPQKNPLSASRARRIEDWDSRDVSYPAPDGLVGESKELEYKPETGRESKRRTTRKAHQSTSPSRTRVHKTNLHKRMQEEPAYQCFHSHHKLEIEDEYTVQKGIILSAAASLSPSAFTHTSYPIVFRNSGTSPDAAPNRESSL
ncbi:hypothetical protein MAPG_10452 [Magnaporthiopsis poae ATCC 64411]|uniref:Uncharacterized protein n=1 Tax=Magnaporthiopsis poae (strain ATCC 64411 / 73-15) TaxID=644358 RepID=A0A0C4ECM1_MAGP6|nr:hypothetical protein MAPG_10452 [Magnaporthiopsis poae ATCC 64411]